MAESRNRTFRAAIPKRQTRIRLPWGPMSRRFWQRKRWQRHGAATGGGRTGGYRRDAAGMEEPDTAALGADIQALMEEQKIQPEDEELPKAEKSGGKLAGGGHPKSGASKAKAADDVLPKIEEPEEEGHQAITRLSKEQREIFNILCRLKGMEQQLLPGAYGAAARLSSGKTASTGNMIIQGRTGSGKTVLATSMIKALQKEVGKPNGKNRQDRSFRAESERWAALLKKVAGGCLIIEKAGAISRETAVKLGTLLDSDNSGLFVIMEDTRRGIEKALSRDAGFAARFFGENQYPDLYERRTGGVCEILCQRTGLHHR